MAEPLLDIHRLRVEFRSGKGVLTVVDDISLTIKPGEIMGAACSACAGGRSVRSYRTCRPVRPSKGAT
jgi:peptide/nickel transport system ATP-binding protein